MRQDVETGPRAALIADMTTEMKSPATRPTTPLTTAELVAALQRLDPEGNRLVLLEPVAAPSSLAAGARPVALWDGEQCIALSGRP